MISALAYLQLQTARNRLLVRIRRLRQPKYLFGGIVGVLYFYWYFFRPVLMSTHTGQGASFQIFGITPELMESVVAMVLFVVVAGSWVFPSQRAALTFTEAEIAFLFPAPVSRTGLIHFKLLRSQLAIFFTTLLLTLFSRRFGGQAWIHAAGWWMMLSTLNLHFLAGSFAQTKLMDRGLTTWKRRFCILGLVGVLGVSVAAWVWVGLPSFAWPAKVVTPVAVEKAAEGPGSAEGVQHVQAVRDYILLATRSGPLAVVLYPFRVIARPFLASDRASFLAGFGPALLLMLLHYAWVVRSNVAFEEASVEASRKVAEKVAAIRSGNWQAAQKEMKRRRDPFPLGPVGAKPVALLWKNLLSLGQGFSPGLWIGFSVMLLLVGLSVGPSLGRSGWGAAVGMVFGILFSWSILLGPHLLRQDLRQDLQMMDLLKTYPMRGWQVVLGSMLAPAVILTAVQWLLLWVGGSLLLFAGVKGVPVPAILGVGLGASILVPVTNFLLLLIPNTAVLLLPGWFHTKEAVQGIEATGQRLILMLGQLLALVVALVPASLMFSLIFFLLKFATGALWSAIPVASVAAALVLVGEVSLGVAFLGRVFDKFDLSDELKG